MESIVALALAEVKPVPYKGADKHIADYMAEYYGVRLRQWNKDVVAVMDALEAKNPDSFDRTGFWSIATGEKAA